MRARRLVWIGIFDDDDARTRRGALTDARRKLRLRDDEDGFECVDRGNVPGCSASARRAAWAPRECPTATHRPSTRMARATATRSSANVSHRSAAARREGSVAEGGGGGAVRARASKVMTRTGRPASRSARTAGSKTRPWKPLACARSIVRGVSRSTPGPPGDEAETPWSWTSRTTLSLVGTRTMRMARSGGGAENLSDAVSATARRCGRGGARSRRSRELEDATTTSRDGSRTGVQNPRVRDEAIIRPAICDISVLCVSATPSRWGLGASDGANDTPAERDDGLADVSGSLPESTPRAGRRLQGRRQGAGGVANGDSQALRRASPRATVSSPEEPRLAESRAHPVPPAHLDRNPPTSVPRKPRRRSLKASRRRVSSDCTSCRR